VDESAGDRAIARAQRRLERALTIASQVVFVGEKSLCKENMKKMGSWRQ
jgi:hypothetical protein